MESITDDNDKSFIQVQKHKNKTKNHISEQKKKCRHSQDQQQLYIRQCPPQIFLSLFF